MPIQVFGQDRQTIYQQLHSPSVTTHFLSEARQNNVEKMEEIKKLEEIKRDTFSSLEELEEKISSVMPMDVIKVAKR